eukprot:CAMPEP_0185210096 /NCGR_PEP_ID=MMETSP1140-20130426/64998_1 /TAXON_ID=298111 /ORGANISM="Pavlova sp., Strain CCMP459" /LENGTH=96 /DNA_ID=CAMNT_0027777891 /DNA_START=42 /DNA_END=329 /DNA_ORIENTATION=+
MGVEPTTATCGWGAALPLGGCVAAWPPARLVVLEERGECLLESPDARLWLWSAASAGLLARVAWGAGGVAAPDSTAGPGPSPAPPPAWLSSLLRSA